jgi:hypothetical protein
MTATTTSLEHARRRRDLVKRIKTYNRPLLLDIELVERAKLVAELRSSVQQECLEIFHLLKDEGIIQILDGYNYNNDVIACCQTPGGVRIQMFFKEHPTLGWTISVYTEIGSPFLLNLVYIGKDFHQMTSFVRDVASHS